jgi:hypothetical protein
MSKQVVPKIPVESMIHEIRGQRVILDSDLASIYGVETRVLLQQVRNPEKFPADFLYLLTNKELMGLRSQIVISKGRGGRRTPPMAFTEYGAIMAATVRNSPEAVAMSIFVVRAFVKMREVASGSAPWMKKLREVEAALAKRMDGMDQSIGELFMELENLIRPSFPVPEKRAVGFRIPQGDPRSSK